MRRGFYPARMKNFTPWIDPVPAPEVSEHDEAPARCIRISEALIPYLLGMLELARYPHVFSGSDEDKLRAVKVFQDLAAAFAIEDVCIDCGDDMPYLLRQNPDNPCQLEQSTNDGATWTLAFDYALCMRQEELNPPLTQYEPIYGGLQTSYDGGESWHSTPDNRFKAPLTNNIWKEEADPACLTSANAVEFFKTLMVDEDEETAVALIAAIVSILATIIVGGVAAPVITALVEGYILHGIAAFQAAMTEAEWDKFRLNLYCHASADGSWTLPAYYQIMDQVVTDHAGHAEFFLYQSMIATGWIGLNNASHFSYVTSDECSELECDPTCLEPFTPGVKVFTLDDTNGWSIEAGTLLATGVVRGVYAPSPVPEVLVQLCFEEDFRVTDVSFQVQRLGSGNVAMKYEMQLRDSEGGLVAAHVFFDNNTGGFTWFSEGIDNWNKNDVRKVLLIGTKVPEGQDWEFRNITVVVEDNP